MKKYLMLSLFISLLQTAFGQYVIKGSLYSADDGLAIAGATLTTKQSQTRGFSDGNGQFNIIINRQTDTLLINMLGYSPKQIPLQLPLQTALNIKLDSQTASLKEVVISTGYEQIPKERVTGSFTQIDQALLNRSVSTDIISRLEGVTSGLQFERRGTLGEGNQPASLRVRGLSTILSDNSPLIVLNNFPFEGDINDINPNDVENITILKDAAAASIWGARAGNGVIVITTKSGKYNQQARLNFNSNVNIIQRPNLSYNPNFIPATPWMEVENYLFQQGYYDEEAISPLPPYVELLIRQRDNTISAADFNSQQASLQQQDIRREASRLLYQEAINQQYALNMSGGSAAHHYYLSAGYDQNRGNSIGDAQSRISLTANNQIKLSSKLDFSSGIYYTQNNNQENGLTLEAIKPPTLGLIPYTQLADDTGNPLAVLRDYRLTYTAQAPANGLLNWDYRPLDEQRLADRNTKAARLRVDAGLRYKIVKNLSADAKYQYQQQNQQRSQRYDKDSYFTRNLVNRFTQSNNSRVIPYGDILQEGDAKEETHYGRFQLNYQNSPTTNHQLAALAGAEIRQERYSNGPGYQVYDYNGEVLTSNILFDYTRFYPTRPQGSARIPANPFSFGQITERNLSYFANAAYTYKQRYVLSASSRWDASNLFGVKTNQKGVPLWSVGGAWQLSKENWWQSTLFPELRLRATYGYNGNVNRQVSVFPTFQSASSNITGLATGIITNPGNPSLRWERVQIINLGADIATKNNRIAGSVEYFYKNASDLIGEIFADPTTGLSNIRNRVNYAGMKTRGLDIDVSSKNLIGTFNWQSHYLISHVRNRVSNYAVDNNQQVNAAYLSPVPLPEVGTSLDAIYALPWQGLSSINGQQQVLLNGALSQDYTAYLNSLSRADLVLAGVTVPTWYGAYRNTFTYKNLSLSANISWKAGYVFRRSSINYNQLYNQGLGHIDYLNRWQNPGDEARTQVPARPNDVNNNRDVVYTYSSQLVEDGAHIRLQDLQLSYTLKQSNMRKLPFNSLRLSLYAANLGILWRANEVGLDPDYANAAYPAARSLAIGLNANF